MKSWRQSGAEGTWDKCRNPHDSHWKTGMWEPTWAFIQTLKLAQVTPKLMKLGSVLCPLISQHNLISIIFGMATPASKNAKGERFQPHSSQREALPDHLRDSSRAAGWNFALWIILQPCHNTIFRFRQLNFFFSLFSGAFLNIDINLLSWKQPKLLYFLSSPIVCTSDLFTKGPGLHSHKSWDSAVLWY